MIGLNWRYVYFLSIGIRFVFALSDSYIHPDEHFQSFEPLAGEFLGFSTNPPWEFSSEVPARSIALLKLLYYPVMALASKFGLLPIQMWYLARLQLMVVSWIITDWCLYRMLPTKQERIKAIFFTLTSYVSLVYQCHTFSNSVETVLVVLTVYMLNELRFLSTVSDKDYQFREVATLGLGIGICGAVGVFNRVTFPAFFVFPAWYFLKCCWKWKLLIFFTTAPFIAVSYFIVVADTAIFKHKNISEVLSEPFTWEQYVITPFNNLNYNSQYSNLAKHGIHLFYTHILVNLPQLLGPGIMFLFYGFKNRYWKTTPFIAGASGVVFLSLVPHQELRFLVPVVPLLCCCFDLTAFLADEKRTPVAVNVLLNCWLLFNILLGLLMGTFHQGGVVPAVEYLRSTVYLNQVSGVTQVWWRTYSPPTWMLGDTLNSTQFITYNDEKTEFTIDNDKLNHIIDTMGLDIKDLRGILTQVKSPFSKTYLITPVASFNKNFHDRPHNRIWLYNYHLDMDHLDFTDARSLQPGLGIFELF